MNTSPRPRRAFDTSSSAVRKYRRRAGLSIHPLVVLALLVVSFGIIFAFGIYWITSRSVNVVIDGVQRQVRTHQSNVNGLLSELSIFTEPPDIISPAGNTAIVNGLTVTIQKAHPVLIEVDGKRRRVLTHLMQPRDILAEAEIAMNTKDTLYVDGLPFSNQPYAHAPEDLFIVRAFTVSLQDGGTVTELHTVARTVGEALAESNIDLYLADRIEPPLYTALVPGSSITIQRSVPITIQVDGRALATRTGAKTVGGALAESGIAPFGMDYVLPDNDAPIRAEMVIRVIRVTEEEEIEQRTLAFQQRTQVDTSIPPETQKIIQPGEPGIIERRVRVRREDGVIVSRSAPQEVVIRPPRDEITLIGATPELIQPDTSTQTPEGTKVGS